MYGGGRGGDAIHRAARGGAPDVSGFETASGPDACGTRHAGRERVRAAFARLFELFPDARFGQARHFLAGDRGVSGWVFTGTTTDGRRVEVDGCDLFTFRHGKIALKTSSSRPARPRPPPRLGGDGQRAVTVAEAGEQRPVVRVAAETRDLGPKILSEPDVVDGDVVDAPRPIPTKERDLHRQVLAAIGDAHPDAGVLAVDRLAEEDEVAAQTGRVVADVLADPCRVRAHEQPTQAVDRLRPLAAGHPARVPTEREPGQLGDVERTPHDGPCRRLARVGSEVRIAEERHDLVQVSLDRRDGRERPRRFPVGRWAETDHGDEQARHDHGTPARRHGRC
jgi:ketosteroid isomerase-like protein